MPSGVLPGGAEPSAPSLSRRTGASEGAGITGVSAAFSLAVPPRGSSSAEVLGSSVPDAVSLYPDGDGRNEPTRGSMTLPLCQPAHLNIFGCFWAVLRPLLLQA